MTRIGKKFAELKRDNQKALITFVTAGDPDMALTERLIPAMAAAGADIIELGMPFSDPMADGATIQLASDRALASGTTLAAILAMARRVRQHCDVPLLLMGYYNPVFAFGPERFCSEAADAGVDGILLVDLPPEEAGELLRYADDAGIDFISLLTPTSDAARIDKVKAVARGFIYYVSVAGVTGARETVAADIAGMVAKIHSRTELPVAVGFGISTPEQAGAVAAIADGVVVGSALVRLFEQYQGDELVSRVTSSVKRLKEGVLQID